uniref:Tetratricopeptide repeat protein 21A/21B N-terminal ARM repeat domain-containing protein n=1 Tax=Acrobeloides nanus TaxID=290746 RepID=A0A914E5Y6_9BILA
MQDEFSSPSRILNLQLNSKPAEAIRLLGALKKTSTLSLSSSCTLKVAYSSEAVIDRDSLKEVELEINKFWSSSDNVDVYLAIIILTLEGTYDRARSLLDRLSLVFGTTRLNFDAAIRIDNLPEGFFGKAKVFEERHNANDFRATVNELLDEHSTLVPAYIEMIRATIMSHDWEKANELTQNASLIQ